MNSRVRKFAIRSTIGLLIGLVVCCIVPAVVLRLVMHSRLNSMRDQAVKALQTAESIRLEEFDDSGKVVSRRDLDSEQRVAANESIRGGLGGGAGFTLSMCWVPHHRVIARDAKGSEFALTICFGCDEARITGYSQFPMPTKWKSSLRQLFEQNGFRCRREDGIMTWVLPDPRRLDIGIRGLLIGLLPVPFSGPVEPFDRELLYIDFGSFSLTGEVGSDESC